jgi:hypothetical protein
MESKHTPGPWRAFTNPITNKSTIGNEGGANPPLAKVEKPEDARLIAQAPTMLKACRMALEDLMQTVNYDERDPQTLATVAALEEVIAAATNP